MKATHFCLFALLFLASTVLGCTAEPAKIPPPAEVERVPEDATTLPSGLAYKVLREGTGERHPGPKSTVKVHYTGWTTDGEMFDSSVSRGEPISLGLDQVIAGWQEGVQLMVVGEQRRFWIPSNLAYEGRSGAPQGMLVFDIELLDIED
ncbi:MAG: FKBP-type peptidyl-prolyl cis-trans isomerase [Phycisphaerales bacterium JB038]